MDDVREPLTQREVEILEMVATGVTNREIAYRLGISVNTVKVHLRNLYSKLGAESRTEATVIGAREGIVDLHDGSSQRPAPPAVRPPRPIAPPLPAWKRVTTVAAVLLVIVSIAATSPSSGAENGGTSELPWGGQASGSQAGIAVTGESSWSERAQMPTRRAYLALAAVDGRILAIGGLTPDGPTAAVERYDPDNDLWTRGADKPTPVFGISAALMGEEIVVPGGCDEDSSPVRGVEAYNSRENSWRELSPLPQARCGYGLAVLDQRVYLFGGWDGARYRADTYVYDAAADTWTESEPMDAGRAFLSASTLGRLIYVVGGYDGTQELGICSVFDPSSETWSACPPLAVGRAGLGLAALAGQLYAIGASGETTYLGFNEQYNPSTGSWATIETPVVGEWRGPGVAVLEGTIYAIGGGWDSGQLAINQAYEPLPFRIFVPVSQQQ
jgi:DNA-binding CsgD family transcriptional regulator/N-acetylneuraminic acid mutarotase